MKFFRTLLLEKECYDRIKLISDTFNSPAQPINYRMLNEAVEFDDGFVVNLQFKIENSELSFTARFIEEGRISPCSIQKHESFQNEWIFFHGENEYHIWIAEKATVRRYALFSCDIEYPVNPPPFSEHNVNDVSSHLDYHIKFDEPTEGIKIVNAELDEWYDTHPDLGVLNG